ncbi:MAG: hypothetical protein AAGA65_26505, partial [Actinomycetota bacterium]
YVVARAFEADSTLGPRSKRVLAMLDEGPLTEEQWREVANRSDGMSTNLSRIDGAAAGDVVWHAYILTMCNLHVLLDYPIGVGLPPRERFR